MGGQGGFNRRIEVFGKGGGGGRVRVKIQKKNNWGGGGGGGGGIGSGGGGGGPVKFNGFFSKVNQVIYSILIISYQLTKFQASSSNTF